MLIVPFIFIGTLWTTPNESFFGIAIRHVDNEFFLSIGIGLIFMEIGFDIEKD